MLENVIVVSHLWFVLDGDKSILLAQSLLHSLLHQETIYRVNALALIAVYR